MFRVSAGHKRLVAMTCNNCNQSRRSCTVHQLLAEDKADIVRRFQSKTMPVIDENDSGYPRQSRANVGISQLNVPLVWNGDLHFKSKGDSRTYTMFAVLQTKTKVVDSRMITNIDRTVTDVVFPESYVFEAEPDDFCVEISLFAARTDQGLVDSGGSLRSKITRSLGRKFGTNVKSQLSTMESNKMSVRPDSVLGGTHFNLLARAYLVLTDAGEDCKIHDLKLSAFADLSGPPLYGHIMCRMVVQPLSVLHPLAEGNLTVKPLGENTSLCNVKSRLQAGYLTCYMNVDVHQCPSREEILMQIPITAGSKIVSTAYPFTFLLATEGTNDTEGSEIFVSADNEKLKDGWKRAIEAQIADCEIWGDFAYTPMKLTHEKRRDPVKETLSRATGNNLYDKISITGTISKGTLTPSLSPSISYCPRDLSPLRTDLSKTAPTRRNKQRTNVLDIFPSPAPSGDSPNSSIQDNDSWGYVKESSSVYTPMSTRMRDPTAMDYSSLSRYDTYSNGSNPYANGKKSWSRSIGEFIGKKMNTPTVQVTRL